MNYKTKSLLYLLAFIASALIYYTSDQPAGDHQPGKTEMAAEIPADKLPSPTL